MKKRIPVITVLLCLLLGICLCGCRFLAQKEQAEPLEGTRPCDVLTLELTGPELPSRDTLLQYTNLQELDIRNLKLTVGQYEQLRQDLPGCEILWLVPFQSDYLSADTRELTITELSSADFESIPYLPNLEKIYANECRDYEQLIILKEIYPHLDVFYTVSVQGQQLPWDIEILTLEDADISTIAGSLPYLPKLKQVFFTGDAPENEDIYELMCRYPQISFEWDLTLFGITIPNTAQTLVLSDIPMADTSEVESYLRYFPNLERVEMCNCGIPSDQMDALSQRYPSIRFIWTVKIGRGTLRTDAQAFIPFTLGYDIDRPLGDAELTELKYCTDLVCLDLGHMKVRDISFLEYMPNMQYLVLVDMPCKDFSVLANLKELIYLELFNVQFTEHEILLELTKLEDLNISSTPTRDTEILKQMTWLKRLWLVRTKLNGSQVEELRQSLPNTEIVIYALHSTDKGWRDNQNYRDMRDLLGMFYMN